MPSALARQHGKMRKPTLKERMGQSQKDKTKRRRIKLPANTSPVTFHTSTTSTTDTNEVKQYSMNVQQLWSMWANNTATVTCAVVPWFLIDTGTNCVTWSQWQDPQVHPKNSIIRPVPFERVELIESEEDKKRRLDKAARYRKVQEEAEKEYKEQQRKMQEAKDRAMKLLLSCLTQEQKDCLTKNKYFYVKAKSGRLYRIDQGTHGNVKVVDPINKTIIERLCIQPNGVPEGDVMLAQKLLIETSEEVFRRHANITLNDFSLIYGDKTLLDSDKLAKVIPIRKAA